jgi:hypothetical protein
MFKSGRQTAVRIGAWREIRQGLAVQIGIFNFERTTFGEILMST